jgi:hypothetical protein
MHGNTPFETILRLLSEEHSKAQTIRIAEYVEQNKEHFKALVELIDSSDLKIGQRASWPLTLLIETRKEWFVPHVPRFIEILQKPKHNAVVRNILRSLEQLPIPESNQGELVSFCFGKIKSSTEPVANQIFAMQIVYNMAMIYPELQHELELIIREQLEFSKPGFRSRGKRILKAFGHTN